MIYEHYKGGLYRVIWSAVDHTRARFGSPVVVYMSLKSGEILVRDANEFYGDVRVANSGLPMEFEWVKRFRQVTS